MAAREAGTVSIWHRGTEMLCLAKMNCDSFFEVEHVAALNKIGMLLARYYKGIAVVWATKCIY